MRKNLAFNHVPIHLYLQMQLIYSIDVYFDLFQFFINRECVVV